MSLFCEGFDYFADLDPHFVQEGVLPANKASSLETTNGWESGLAVRHIKGTANSGFLNFEFESKSWGQVDLTSEISVQFAFRVERDQNGAFFAGLNNLQLLTIGDACGLTLVKKPFDSDNPSTTEQFDIRFTTNTGGALGQQVAYVVPNSRCLLDGWYHVSVKVSLGQATDGLFRITIYDEQENLISDSTTIQDTVGDSSTSGQSKVTFTLLRGMSLDDVVIRTGLDSPGTNPTPRVVHGRKPEADGAISDWSLTTPGSDHFEAVDDRSTLDSLDLSAASTGSTELFEMEDIFDQFADIPDAASIEFHQVDAIVSAPPSSFSDIDLAYRNPAGTIQAMQTNPVTTDAANQKIAAASATDPVDGLLWTKQKIDNGQFGVQLA